MKRLNGVMQARLPALRRFHLRGADVALVHSIVRLKLGECLLISPLWSVPPMQVLPAPTYVDVVDAAARLEGVAHRTPVLTSNTANERTGASIFFK